MHKLGDKIVDKILERIANIAVVAISSVAVIGLSLIPSYVSDNLKPILLVLGLSNILWIALVLYSRRNRRIKSGNLWWLCYDLLQTSRLFSDSEEKKQSVNSRSAFIMPQSLK